jgi:hypothetical protein
VCAGSIWYATAELADATVADMTMAHTVVAALDIGRNFALERILPIINVNPTLMCLRVREKEFIDFFLGCCEARMM